METSRIIDSFHSYPKIYALGHSAVKELFLDEVLIEEKIDGSQFSACKTYDGELKCRSKGAIINTEYPEKMFSKAVKSVQEMDLINEWTYRFEYLQSPKHNALAYDRVPEKNLILFDINVANETYLSHEEKSAEALRLGVEVVPVIYHGLVADPSVIIGLLDRVSILGGQKIEGVVVKNYNRFGADKKALMGKYVSEAFKEVHGSSWKEANPTKTDLIQSIILAHRTPARWGKAVQHLKERGEITSSPKDIGAIIKEVHADLAAEQGNEIREALYRHAMSHIQRGVAAGVAEWYKEELLKQQFNAVQTD